MNSIAWYLWHTARWQDFANMLISQFSMYSTVARVHFPTIRLRARDGAPIWVIARRTVASYVDGVPELLQGTFIDITAQKKAQARLRDIIGGQSSGATPEGESAGISGLSQRIANILRRVNTSLHPDSLPQIDRAEMQECSAALEQMKMLMSELEILRLGLK